MSCESNRQLGCAGRRYGGAQRHGVSSCLLNLPSPSGFVCRLLVASRQPACEFEPDPVMKPSFPLDAKSILDLQRTAGNQCVVRLLRKRSRPKAVIVPEVLPETLPQPPPALTFADRSIHLAWWQPAVTVLGGLAGYVVGRLTFPASPFAAIAAG